MRNVVDKPIINDPFEEPTRHYLFSRDEPPRLVEGRRGAGYYYNPRTRGSRGMEDEALVPLELANAVRERVRIWRDEGWPGATNVTKDLLAYWNRPKAEAARPLFFCQREAAETVVWLVEGPEQARQGLDLPSDGTLRRYCCKMATGSGKTVVMAMLAAWSILNKATYRQDPRFSDGILVVCPNLTIKERLQVLIPGEPGNYYERFELVPREALATLGRGRFEITNWHIFLRKDDTNRRTVEKKGEESDKALVNRSLRNLGRKGNLLVFNDEAHHAYRPAPLTPEEEQKLTKDEKAERLEATVWVEGLDAVARERGVDFCVDFSATPLYLKGDPREGTPFPWVVSDFGLVDAIESGIVKVPRVAVAEDTGARDPKYFHIWEYVKKALGPSRRKDPEAVWREVHGAFASLASAWKRDFEQWKKELRPVPPVLAVVCDNTKLAEVVDNHVKAGDVLAELANEAIPEHDTLPTVRIDTRLLEQAESRLEGETRADAGERLRGILASVGKVGGDGEQVRCVVSVGMLSEGWDAHNVTQILGLRAFTSQLLCEQVVGRGLRRTNYDLVGNPDAVEYVDVYGVPFEVIPVASAEPGDRPEVKEIYLVRALPDRKEYEIEFPRLEGYVCDVRQRVKADIAAMPELIVGPGQEPVEVRTEGGVPPPSSGLKTWGYLGPETGEFHGRDEFYAEHRVQRTIYEIAADVTACFREEARHILFPQVLAVVDGFVNTRVRAEGDTPLEEIALEKYRTAIRWRVYNAIEPDEETGETPLLPALDRFRPRGSTEAVMFNTTRDVESTNKSHVNYVVLDNGKWERSAAYYLERMPEVVAYVKTDGLGFTIPYIHDNVTRNYRPDFIIKYRRGDDELNVVMEVKGFEPEEDKAKRSAAQRWVSAVNHHGGFGRWEFVVCRNPATLPKIMERR
jgi:type III restriction enzyme